MRPSRTREERKTVAQPISDSELRVQLEEQAILRKKQQLIENLKEKKELLAHYENQRFSSAKNDDDLNHFLAAKKKELENINHQIEVNDPGMYAHMKQYEQKFELEKETRRKDIQTPLQNDFFFGQEDPNKGFLSKGEADREKRLKLREQERQRRLAGNKESAYEINNKFNLPEIPTNPIVKQQDIELPINKKYKQNEAIFGSPNRLLIKARDQVRQYEDFPVERIEQNPYFNNQDGAYSKETVNPYEHRGVSRTIEDEIVTKRGNTPNARGYNPREELHQDFGERQPRNMLPPSREMPKRSDSVSNQPQDNGNPFGQKGNPDRAAELEKKRKYKEELDAFMKQKRELSANTRDTHRIPDKENLVANQQIDRNPYSQDDNLTKRTQSSNAYNRPPLPQQNHTEVRHSYEQYPSFPQKNVEQYYQQQNFQELPTPKNIPGYVQNNYFAKPTTAEQSNDKLAEIEKKRKYKEELDAMVQEKRKIQSAIPGYRREASRGNTEQNLSPEQKLERAPSDNMVDRKSEPSSYFNKAAEEEDKRKVLEKNQKQRMAEELKKQMEEKEIQKKLEKQKRAEEELREKERLERDLEIEKRRLDEENKKKHDQERKNQEANNRNQALHQHHLQLHQQQIQQPTTRQVTSPQNIETPVNNSKKFFDAPRSPTRDHNEKDNLASYHPYLSNQKFNPKSPPGTKNVVTVDPSLFPRNPSYPTNMSLQETNQQQFQQQYMPQQLPSPQYNPGFAQGNPFFMPQMPPMSNPYQAYPQYGMQFNPQMQQFYNYNQNPNMMYNDLALHRQIMQDLLEERQRIEQLAKEEQQILDRYRDKIRDARNEKDYIENEIEKMKGYLDNVSYNPNLANQMSYNPYFSALQELHIQKNQHMNIYNRLMVESQNSLANVINHYTQFVQIEQPQQTTNNIKEVENEVSEISLDHHMRQSLPSSSNYVQNFDQGAMEKSFIKDFEAFQDLQKQVLQYENMRLDPNFLMDYKLMNGSVDEYSTSTQLRADLSQGPYYSIIQPDSANKTTFTKNYVTINEELRASSSLPGNSEFNMISDIQPSMMNPMKEPSLTDRAYYGVVSPVVDGKSLIRKDDTTPQVIYAQTPADEKAEDALRTKHKNKSAIAWNQLKPSSSGILCEDNYVHKSVPELNNNQTGKFPYESEQPLPVNQTDTVRKTLWEEERALTGRGGRHEKSETFQEKESGFSSPGDDTTHNVEETKHNPEQIHLEDELKSERSLVLGGAEEYDEEEINDFIESNDRAFQELRFNLSKSNEKNPASEPSKWKERVEPIVPAARISENKSGLNVKTSGIVLKNNESGFTEVVSPTAKSPTKLGTTQQDINESSQLNPFKQATSRNSMSFHGDKKFKTPRIIDPFAKAGLGESKINRNEASIDSIRTPTRHEMKPVEPLTNLNSSLKKSPENQNRDSLRQPNFKNVEEETWEESSEKKNTLYLERQLESLQRLQNIDPRIYNSYQASEVQKKIYESKLDTDDENQDEIEEKIGGNEVEEEVDNLEPIPQIKEESRNSLNVSSQKPSRPPSGSSVNSKTRFSPTKEPLTKVVQADPPRKSKWETKRPTPAKNDQPEKKETIFVNKSIFQQEMESVAETSGQEGFEYQTESKRNIGRSGLTETVNDTPNHQRSKLILDRLQKLFEGMADPDEDVAGDSNSNRIHEVSEEGDDQDKIEGSRDSLFKPMSGTRSTSNRYSTQEL